MYARVGLSKGAESAGYSDIDYALWATATGQLWVFESGSDMSYVGDFGIGDTLKVAVESGVVKYYKNNNLLYTSTDVPGQNDFPLNFDASLGRYKGLLHDAFICGNNLTQP